MMAGSVSASLSTAPGQRIAAERSEPHLLERGRLARRERHPVIVHHDERAVAFHHWSFAS